jgi:hypothetical protein
MHMTTIVFQMQFNSDSAALLGSYGPGIGKMLAKLLFCTMHTLD